jgi:hypothetical protein
MGTANGLLEHPFENSIRGEAAFDDHFWAVKLTRYRIQ